MAQRRRNTPDAGTSLGLSTINYALLAGGVAALALGFTLLAGGSTVAAPLLLALGYVVLIPLGIVR